VVLRSDVERKALFGKGENVRLPQDAYSRSVTARVYASIADKARRAVAAGHSAILDAVFATPQERAAAAASAEILGVAFHGLFLEADLDTRLARLSARGRDPSDADAAVARMQQSYELSALDWTRIDASGTPDETLARARKAINPMSASAAGCEST
jgi:predicted kinase